MMGAGYQPGVCNIGRQERRVRYGFGVAGFAAAAALVAAAVVLSWPRWTLLATTVPLSVGFIGVNQGRKAFCVKYAWEGVHNVTDRPGDATDVADRDATRADRRRAQRLIALSAGYSVAVALVLYLVVPL